MNYGNSYTNPYLTNNTSYPTNFNGQQGFNPNVMANGMNQFTGASQIPAGQTPQPDATNYVSKEDYDKLLQEKRKLQEQLENEMAQRVDIEFFKKEQEMIRLPEGQRLMQELEYQKTQFFEAFWRTSDSGKDAMKNYRDSVNVLYDRYRTGAIAHTMNTDPIDTSADEGETVF